MLTAPALTLLFLGVVVSLGAAFMWMFWEIEQGKQRRQRARFRGVARASSSERPRNSAPPEIACVATCTGQKTRPSTQYNANGLASPGY